MEDLNNNVNNPVENDLDDPTLDNQPDEPKGEKHFSQQELDDIVTRRLARERKQWERALDEERKKANMDELDRVKHEKEKVEEKLSTTLLKANERMVHAEAKVQALALGIEAKKLPYLLKLADLEIQELVHEDGQVDEKGVKNAIKTVLADFPELASKPKVSKGGTDFSKGNDKSMSLEQFKKMSYKEKVNLFNTNPELYKSLSK